MEFTMPGIGKITSPPIRLSELDTCFYCGGTLPATEKEHLFNSCWGGSHKTSKAICNECNQYFSKIDSSFISLIYPVMNAWQFKGERHKGVPDIKTSDEKYLMTKGGKPKLNKPVVEIETDDGQIKTGKIIGNSKNEIKKWLESGELEKALGKQLSEEQKENLLATLRAVNKSPQSLEQISFPIYVDLQEQYRSIAHTLLKTLAFYRPNLILDGTTQSLRDFARNNTGSWQEYATEIEPTVSPGENIGNHLGVFHNRAEIFFLPENKTIIGTVTILDRIRKSIVISRCYEGDFRGILCVTEEAPKGKKLKAMEVSIEPVDIPLLFMNKCLSIQEIENQYGKIIYQAFSIDSIEGELLYSLEQLAKKYEKLTEVNITELENVLLNFLERMAHFFKVTLSREELKTLLYECGFAQLPNQLLGMSFSSSEVQQAAGHALICVLKKLKAQASQ